MDDDDDSHVVLAWLFVDGKALKREVLRSTFVSAFLHCIFVEKEAVSSFVSAKVEVAARAPPNAPTENKHNDL